MAQRIVVPLLGSDGETYYFRCDASGGSAGNTPGAGLVQVEGTMANFAELLVTASGAGPTLWKPDATHQAVRLVSIINAGTAPITAILTLYDDAAGGTTNQFWSGPLGGTVIVPIAYPLTNGLTWALDNALPAGASIALLAN